MRVLVAEDDEDLAGQMVASLKDAGYAVDHADNGEDAHFMGDTEPYDAVILDLGLPMLDGISVLNLWRQAGRSMPVLILTARDSWNDKVKGLDAGADDYVTKPFELAELLARLRALIRRAAGHATSELVLGPVMLDTRNARIWVSGEPVRLTALEFKLFSYLMHHQDQVISRTELTEHIYDQDFDRDSNTIEVFVNRIRKKLGVDLIQTVRGLGYRLEAPTEDQKTAPSQKGGQRADG
ncbi:MULTISPECIES: response regulator transcription factor [unclassified Iodidimonas]|jgi:two-component system OmpR family response regulator|uniref:response regulator transcription factor n=1 Tax=unclassified Iodidimonas TaxID=2626145 RepID=UPI0024826282|nr:MULTISPECIES: response regulator transcription factor [unclassified Iodidimonas]